MCELREVMVISGSEYERGRVAHHTVDGAEGPHFRWSGRSGGGIAVWSEHAVDHRIDRWEVVGME